jgi:hypothetical protein
MVYKKTTYESRDSSSAKDLVTLQNSSFFVWFEAALNSASEGKDEETRFT